SPRASRAATARIRGAAFHACSPLWRPCVLLSSRDYTRGRLRDKVAPHAPTGRNTRRTIMANETAGGGNFIRDILLDDNRSGRYGGRVATRFPPEPNGYLHIGHAKAICIDFGLARELGGTCNLRFDDTNPTTEDVEYVEAIQEDIRWLGFAWSGLYYASDYFE